MCDPSWRRGVIFTSDTETGFRDAVATASYVGENVVQER